MADSFNATWTKSYTRFHIYLGPVNVLSECERESDTDDSERERGREKMREKDIYREPGRFATQTYRNINILNVDIYSSIWWNNRSSRPAVYFHKYYYWCMRLYYCGLWLCSIRHNDWISSIAFVSISFDVSCVQCSVLSIQCSTDLVSQISMLSQYVEDDAGDERWGIINKMISLDVSCL